LTEELRNLFDIQKLDTQLIEHERKQSAVPRRISDMEQELQKTKEKIAKEKEVMEELDKERRRKEKELDSEKERIKKVQGRLLEIKTNKEYQAVLKEIEAAQAANDKTEEEIILLLERIEELKKDYEAATAHLKKREKEVDAEKKGLEKEMSSLGNLVAQLKKERDALFSSLGKEAQSRYKMRMEKLGGVAVVNVNNGVCLGCVMNIPPQLVIDATQNSQLSNCPSCNRIFFYEEQC